MNTVKKEAGEILESSLAVAAIVMMGAIGTYLYSYAEKINTSNKENTPIHSKEVKKVTHSKTASQMAYLNRSKQNTK